MTVCDGNDHDDLRSYSCTLSGFSGAAFSCLSGEWMKKWNDSEDRKTRENCDLKNLTVWHVWQPRLRNPFLPVLRSPLQPTKVRIGIENEYGVWAESRSGSTKDEDDYSNRNQSLWMNLEIIELNHVFLLSFWFESNHFLLSISLPALFGRI